MIFRVLVLEKLKNFLNFIVHDVLYVCNSMFNLFVTKKEFVCVYIYADHVKAIT